MNRGPGCAWLVLAYPFLEAVAAIAVASIWGWWTVLVCFTLGLLIGLIVVRLGARAAGRSWNAAMRTMIQRQGSDAGPEGTAALAGPDRPADRSAVPRPPAETLLIVPAGILIAIPGFLSDIAGAVLLLPWTRRRVARRWEGRMRGY